MDPTIAILILCIVFVLLIILRFPISLALAGSSLLTLLYLKVPWQP